MKPIGKRIIIRKQNKEEKVNGIILPDAGQKSQIAVVVAIGKEELVTVRPGDSVMLASSKIGFPLGDDLYLITEDEIAVIMDKSAQDQKK